MSKLYRHVVLLFDSYLVQPTSQKFVGPSSQNGIVRLAYIAVASTVSFALP